MDKFTELLEGVKKSLNDKITTETPDDEIKSITGIIAQCDELSEEHKKLQDTCVDYKQKYIDGIKNFGTKDIPQEQKQARSLEEIALEVIAQRKKK